MKVEGIKIGQIMAQTTVACLKDHGNKSIFIMTCYMIGAATCESVVSTSYRNSEVSLPKV